MIQLLILYAPEQSALKKCAESLQKAFDKKIFRTIVRSAAKSHLPDIASAQAVILGCRAQDGAPVHADFAEMVRSFSGVNLAGRCAGFFGEKGSATAGEFASALADSDIVIYGEPLVLDEKGFDAQKMKRWTAQFSTFVRKNLND
jgi:flavodoxin